MLSGGPTEHTFISSGEIWAGIKKMKLTACWRRFEKFRNSIVVLGKAVADDQ